MNAEKMRQNNNCILITTINETRKTIFISSESIYMNSCIASGFYIIHHSTYFIIFLHIHKQSSAKTSATDPFTPLAAEQLRLAGRAVAAEAAVALGAEGTWAVGVEEAPCGFV